MAMWLKITGMGENWQQCDRMRETTINQSCSVPPLSLLIKDHKPVAPGELPQTRPVVSGCDGMDVHFGNIVSEHLDAISEAEEQTIDVISTEDFLNKVDVYNDEQTVMNDGKVDSERDSANDDECPTMPEEKVAFVGADAKCLYPSCKGRHTGRCVREAALRSKVKVEGWNYKEAARYIVMGYDRFEIRQMGLDRIVPKRKYKNGTTPGITGPEVLGMHVEDEVKWIFPDREATEVEKKKMYAACLEIGVRAAFSLHLYQFGGRIYHQRDGGPIGMRLAGAAAKIVMQKWSTEMMRIMEDNKIKVHLAAIYVDDARFLTQVLKKGWRWESKEKKFKFEEKWREVDENEQLDDNVRHAREVKSAMNSIMPDIQFETELPEDFPNKRLPTLDFEMWLEREIDNEIPGVPAGIPIRKQKIMYSFFEKPMASPFSVMERSAQPENTKNSTLAQDLVRRMFNTSEMLPQEERDMVIEKYILRLRRSGYSKKQVENIIISGLKGYETKKEKARKNNKVLHRSAMSTKLQRHRDKLMEKSTWFRKEKKRDEKDPTDEKPSWRQGGMEKVEGTNSQPITVLFVPRTKGGELASKIRKAETELESITGYKVKIVERSGTMIKRIVVKSNPWAGGPCGMPECLVCKHENGGGDCKKRSITYRTRCETCYENGEKLGDNKEKIYIGESSRTGRERGAEHANDYHREVPDSHMWKHWQTDHNEDKEKPVFSMKVLKRHKSAFVRQINEAVLIDMNSNKVLNSKSEYNRCQIPRLTVKVGEKDCVEKTVQPMSETEIDLILIRTGEERKRAGEEETGDLTARKRRKVRSRKPEKKIAIKRDRDESIPRMPRKKRKNEEGICSASVESNFECENLISNKKSENTLPENDENIKIISSKILQQKKAVRKRGEILSENKANPAEQPMLASPPSPTKAKIIPTAPPMPASTPPPTTTGEIKLYEIFQFKATPEVIPKHRRPPPPKTRVKKKKTAPSLKQSNLDDNCRKIYDHFKPVILIAPAQTQISQDEMTSAAI